MLAKAIRDKGGVRTIDRPDGRSVGRPGGWGGALGFVGQRQRTQREGVTQELPGHSQTDQVLKLATCQVRKLAG